MKTCRAVAAVLTALALTGCLFPRREYRATAYYDLRTEAPNPAPERAPAPVNLRVGRFSAAIAGTHMLRRRSAVRLDRDSAHRWIDAPERLVEREFLRRMSESGAYRGVYSEGGPGADDLLLEGALLALEETPDRQAFVRLSVEVRRADANPPVLTRVYDRTIPMDGNGPDAFAAAAATALGTLIDRVSADILGGVHPGS